MSVPFSSRQRRPEVAFALCFASSSSFCFCQAVVVNASLCFAMTSLERAKLSRVRS